MIHKNKPMKLRTIMTWLVLAPLMVMADPIATSHYFFRTVNVKDGLVDNFVRDITTDYEGFVWFSTINGVSRYDGYRFHNFMPQLWGGLSGDVAMVRETADSTLWMVCTGELFTYQRAARTWQKDGAEQLERLGVKGKPGLFYVDDLSNLWVTTDRGIYHYDYGEHRLLHFNCPSQAPILHIVAKNGTALIVSSDYNIYKVKSSQLTFLTQAPTMTSGRQPAGSLRHGIRDSRVLIDSRMNLWLYHAHELAGTQWVYSMSTGQWHQAVELRQMGNASVNVIAEDHDGNLWIGTGNRGIHVFTYQDNVNYEVKIALKAFKPTSSHITCFYPDKNNTMWVGSAKLGAAYAILNSPDFNHVSTGDYEDVSSLIEDGQGNLWIGFDGEGIMMKSKTGNTTYFSAQQQQLPSDIITSLAIDGKGNVLVGTYGDGIARFDGQRFTSLYADYDPLQYVKAMTTDKHGNLWVATVDNGVIKITFDGRITNYTSTNTPLPSNGILCLTYDTQRDRIYIGTSTGIAAYDCGKGDFVTSESLHQLNGTYVTSLLVCNSGRLWIGSRNGLWVYDSDDGNVSHLTTDQGLSHNVVRAIAGREKDIWVSTDNGLTCISGGQCYPFYDTDGLQGMVFSNNAALTTSDSTILLGCFTGYVRIPQENIIPHKPKLRIRFTDFRINGSEAEGTLDNFTIHYGERPTIFVSAMVHAFSQKIRYSYRFKGEKEWVRAPGNSLYFVALSSGLHVLQVKAELPGITVDEDDALVGELPINVLPPLWLSTPAILFYLLALAAIVWLLFRAIRRRQNRELAIKQLEMKMEKYEMEEEKIRFFTNISHDLKTPLTLVVAPLEKIRETHLPDAIRTELDVAWRNARQLYDLVLQLLDFRRLDVGKEKLNLRHGDIVNFVKQTAQGFTYFATRKQINLELQLPETSMEIRFDEDKMRRIITNLLSNAYKYNTDNGSVTLKLNVMQEEMILSVADTGIGIHDKRHIFDRFVQETHGQEQEGSGLGLHIVRQYVDMMEGHINVEDNKPHGSVFTITLPIYHEDTASESEGLLSDIHEDSHHTTNPSDINNERKPTILVVDDNTDARLFLQRSLDDNYHVIMASNGQEALNLLEKHDEVRLVVSDVMMPVMDGIELFRNIKSNINFSHIPVILLTAKSSEESMVTSLKEGVADYITKPFSLAVLRLRIQKVMEWTQQVYAQVDTGIKIKPSEITVSSLDEELISHVIARIEENINNIDYSVSQLSSDVGMTRGHLYKKLMAIVGKSPVEFMRIIRLERGKSLLDQGRTNISEVANMVGFSPKQFAHYFKMMFNDTPTDYLKKRE